MASTDKKCSLSRSIGKKLISLAFIIIGLAVLTDLSLRPIIESVNAYECRLALSEMVNSAVNEQLEHDEIDYSHLVDLTTNSSGEVISVESNVMNINRMKTNISTSMDLKLRNMSEIAIAVPIGTLTGVQLLHGKGFDVGLTVKPIGYAQTQIISEFKSVGFNQTRHRILIEIAVCADAIIPGFSTQVEYTTSIIAAEKVIVGKVPDAYTHVVSYDDDLIGTLQDFGAGV